MKQTRNIALERHASLSRRQVLRGLGACITLPTLLSASPAFARVVAKKAAPARMAFVYVPNGAIPAAWWPAGEGGADFALSPTLAPLANLRNHLQVISGLTDISAEAGADGAGDHARAGGTFLTGVRIKKTAGSDIKAGVSIDQVVANQIGHQTRFASLELTCDVVRKSGECDSGYACAYEYNLAWQSSNLDGFVALLREDSTYRMPPWREWYQGRAAIREFFESVWNFYSGFRVVPVGANGQPAFCVYSRGRESGLWRPHSVQVLEILDGEVASLTAYVGSLAPALFPAFRLSAEPPEDVRP